MSTRRFLFVVPPLVGHVNPTISVARALEARGCTVAWAGHPEVVRPLLPAGATLVPLDSRVSPAEIQRRIERAESVRGLEGLKFLWEDFLLPLARETLASVEHAVDEIQPSALVVDQQALAGALVARRRGLRWATLATTSADMVEAVASLPKVHDWITNGIRQLQRDAGLPDGERFDISPHLVIVFTTRALIGEAVPFPAQWRFVGPSIADRPDSTPFPWESLGEDPIVLVSLGTVNATRGARFFGTAIDALGGLPLQVILVAPDGLVGPPPDNVIVLPRVPQLQLLQRVHAVVCHGGHNTVCEALAHGIPLVVAPIKDDQPAIAEQVVTAGAGIRVRFGRVGPDELRTAVRRVLDDESFRTAARRIQASFAEAGGAASAAALLEALAAGV
jgi:MGT family glycosyltransferase